MLKFSEDEDTAAKAELERTLKAVNNANDSRLGLSKRYSVGNDSSRASEVD